MPDAATDRPPTTAALRTQDLRARRRARRRERERQPGPTTLPTITAETIDVPTSAGPLRTRIVGSGPPVLFVHGLLVDGHVWDAVAAELSADHRCILPTLPLGSHRLAMQPGADLAPARIAALLDELCAELELDDVTVVANDSGGAITQLWMANGAPRVGRVICTPVDCFDHFPPPAFKPYLTLARSQAMTGAVLRLALRVRRLRHTPLTYGGLTHRPIDDAHARSWMQAPATDRGVLADLCSFVRGAARTDLERESARLRDFARPVLLAWSTEQAWFPVEHAVRLTRLLPDARIALMEGTGAFPQVDQPAALASLVRDFTRDTHDQPTSSTQHGTLRVSPG